MNEGQATILFKPPAKLLVIDDSHLNRSFIVNAFLPPEYEVLTAVDAQDGMAKARSEAPELILLDIMMPGMDGFEAAKLMREDEKLRDIPIIFITALDAIQDKLKAFEAGAVDFVTKPFNHKELMARVRTHVELRRSVKQQRRMLTIAMDEKRNASIARIAAGVSHNFNNMLGVAFGNIMFVESMIGKGLDPVAKEALTDVRKSLERMQTLVKQFLVIAKRSGEAKGKPQPSLVDLNEMTEYIVSNLLSPKSGNGAASELKCRDMLPKGFMAYCDSGHIREAIHLIINEISETTGGRAAFLIAPCGSASAQPDGFVHFKIDVSGVKLDIGSGENIFEPFALPIANVGAGLSFSVAKHLIEINGGSIKADVHSNGGLEFAIRLPGGEGQGAK